MIYGYARVSTDGQGVAARVAALTAAGAGKVFREAASGAKTDRCRLRHVLDRLDAGDVLMVTRLDRLARSTRDLLNTLAAIAERKAAFRSLGDAWADTAAPHGRLMLTVLGGLAEFERDLIRARTAEGRERAKVRGVGLGRKPKLTPRQQRGAVAAATAATKPLLTRPQLQCERAKPRLAATGGGGVEQPPAPGYPPAGDRGRAHRRSRARGSTSGYKRSESRFRPM